MHGCALLLTLGDVYIETMIHCIVMVVLLWAALATFFQKFGTNTRSKMQNMTRIAIHFAAEPSGRFLYCTEYRTGYFAIAGIGGAGRRKGGYHSINGTAVVPYQFITVENKIISLRSMQGELGC